MRRAPDSSKYVAAGRTIPDGDDAPPAIDSDASTIVTPVGGSMPISGVITDIEDSDGDSIMDKANDAMRVNIVAGAGSGGTAIADEAAFTPGTTSLTPVGGTFTTDTVGAGDAGAFKITAKRELMVAQDVASALKATVELGETDNAVLDAIAASLALLDNAIPTGSELQVDIVADASTTAGDIAHDTGDAGNPVKIGGKVVDMDGTDPGTIVSTQADRANIACDAYGRLLVNTTHPMAWSVNASYTGAQTNTELKAAPGANLALYITDILVSNGAVAGNIRLVEDTASAADKTGKLYFGINAGTSKHFVTPIQLTVNKNLGITSVSCTTHSITICGYTARPTL